ncbi:MAG: DedA family protein [Paraclostridium sp.]|uniref:DedA family protein n=1 Tax=Paraclostridium sp. TaxID=2023273 RepID=UPI003F3DAF6E
MNISVLVETFIRDYGLISIFIIGSIEYLNVPIPSEVVLPLIGVLVIKFKMNLYGVIIAAILGGVIGCIINYYIGYKFGDRFLKFLKTKYPKTQKSIDNSYIYVRKYEKIAIMLSKLVPLGRSNISIVAGATKMNVVLFAIFSGIGIAIWDTVLILTGYIAGNHIGDIIKVIKQYSMMATIVSILAIVLGVVIYKRKK